METNKQYEVRKTKERKPGKTNQKSIETISELNRASAFVLCRAAMFYSIHTRKKKIVTQTITNIYTLICQDP